MQVIEVDVLQLSQLCLQVLHRMPITQKEIHGFPVHRIPLHRNSIFSTLDFQDWLTIAGSTLFDLGHGGYPLYDEKNRWGYPHRQEPCRYHLKLLFYCYIRIYQKYTFKYTMGIDEQYLSVDEAKVLGLMMCGICRAVIEKPTTIPCQHKLQVTLQIIQVISTMV